MGLSDQIGKYRKRFAIIRAGKRLRGRTPEQADMPLLRPPRRPHRYTQITFYSAIPDKRWRPYLFLD